MQVRASPGEAAIGGYRCVGDVPTQNHDLRIQSAMQVAARPCDPCGLPIKTPPDSVASGFQKPILSSAGLI
jgi:hypothetical protein